MNFPQEKYLSGRQVGKSARYYRKLKNSEDMPNLCILCKTSFVSFAALSQHIIGKHSKLECFECNHCGKKGKQKNNVKTYCQRRHPEVNFDILKINEKETESFIQKNSFKGSLEDYNNHQSKQPKVVKKIIRSNNSSPRDLNNYFDDNLSECSTETSFSDNENLSENIISLNVSDLGVENSDECQFEIKILTQINSNLRSLLLSKIKTSIEEIKVLNSLP